jgi:hypothetical protein
MDAAMIQALSDADALYENSKPFSQFMSGQGLKDVLKTTGLSLRDTHRLVPHVRYNAQSPLDRSSNIPFLIAVESPSFCPFQCSTEFP